jgi:hypothetical protein
MKSEKYEKQLKASREWKQRNKEKVAASQKEWRENNVEKRKDLKAAWDKANPDKRKQNHERFKTKRPDYFVNKHLKNTYGIGLEEYNAVLTVQNHKCAGCGIEATKAPRNKLYVDHCHKTNKIRGLLCQHCNTALGMVKDNPETLLSLISYLNEQNFTKN